MKRCYGERISPAYRKTHTRWQRAPADDRGMPSSAPARNAPRIRLRKSRVTGLLIVVAAAAVALGHGSPTSSSSSPPAHPTAAPPIRVPRSERPGAPGRVEGVVSDSRHGGARFGEAGGAVPAGTTVFDDEVPGVAKLNPALLRELRRGATDAGGNGVDFIVNSGWRSAAYEDRLRREAVAKYGSADAAVTSTRGTAAGCQATHHTRSER